MSLQDKGPCLEEGQLIQIFQHSTKITCLGQLEVHTGWGLSEENIRPVLSARAEEQGPCDRAGRQNLTLSCMLGSRGPQGSHREREQCEQPIHQYLSQQRRILINECNLQLETQIFKCYEERKIQETLFALSSLFIS